MKGSLLRSWYAPMLALGLAWPQSREEPQLPAADAAPDATLHLSAHELWEHPAEHLGQTRVLTVQMHRELESWNPFVTRFGDGEFRAWEAWSDEQFPWEEEAFRAPRVRVFARLGSAVEWALSGAESLERYDLTCRVSSTFAGLPWLEVIAAKPHLRALGEGSLIHASRGLDFMEKEAFDAAIAEFERASAGGIPEKAERELDRLIDECRQRQPLELYTPAGE